MLIGVAPIEEFVVVMTKVAMPEPVKVWDEGESTAPDGSPEGVTVTDPVKPCDPLTKTFRLATPFGMLVIIEGVVVIVKSAGPWIVRDAALVLVIPPLVPEIPTRYVFGMVPATAESVIGVAPLLVGPNVAETPAGIP